ncbi:hypothetical protein [Enterobacter kobei]|uniref:hypothetical protein n=1 Tax=Enterobacter kobei TaxID=208224 RepID=UPI0020754A97|nr:hypothetical protein [Enterobacter kobei]MCM7506579.1 hypothetical protein [Enterobacter kobei]
MTYSGGIIGVDGGRAHVFISSEDSIWNASQYFMIAPDETSFAELDIVDGGSLIAPTVNAGTGTTIINIGSFETTTLGYLIIDKVILWSHKL